MGDTVMEDDPPDQDPPRPAAPDDPAEQGVENPRGDADMPPNVERERSGLRQEEGERLRELDERMSQR